MRLGEDWHQMKSAPPLVRNCFPGTGYRAWWPRSGVPSHFCPKVIKMPKIPQHQKYHGIFYCHIVKIFRDIWQINLIGLLRYGNPDVLNLANLKNEIQFHYVLSIFKENFESNFILSHSLNFLSKNLTEMWLPWCKKICFVIMWCNQSVKHHSDFIYQLPIWFLFLH